MTASDPNIYTIPDDPQLGYQRLVASGRVLEDAAQLRIVAALQQLHQQMSAPVPAPGPFSRLLPGRKKAPAAMPRASGIYLWGPVGRGKSMLMDVFFNSAPTSAKERTHFHAFMLEIHRRIHMLRQGQDAGVQQSYANPVEQVAGELAARLRLLCLDELQVTDVADAMILSKLFTALLDAGVTILFTSNRPPESLYMGGLQRERFLAFIQLVVDRMEVLELAGREDYRLKQLRAMERVYASPLGPKSRQFIAEAMERFGEYAAPLPRILEIQGRRLTIDSIGAGIAFCSFKSLCEAPLGAADYLAIARHFHTVILYDIPTLNAEKRNEAKRFVTLIDALYEHRVKLLCSADAPPDALYPRGDGAFEFQRTASRLIEMQAQSYLTLAHITSSSTPSPEAL